MSIQYKAQIIVELTNEAIQNKRSEQGSQRFEQHLSNLLSQEFYKEVEIDPNYKRYGLDIGLVSENKRKLADLCHDLAIKIRENPFLNDIHFDDFD